MVADDGDREATVFAEIEIGHDAVEVELAPCARIERDETHRRFSFAAHERVRAVRQDRHVPRRRIVERIVGELDQIREGRLVRRVERDHGDARFGYREQTGLGVVEGELDRAIPDCQPRRALASGRERDHGDLLKALRGIGICDRLSIRPRRRPVPVRADHPGVGALVRRERLLRERIAGDAEQRRVVTRHIEHDRNVLCRIRYGGEIGRSESGVSEAHFERERVDIRHPAAVGIGCPNEATRGHGRFERTLQLLLRRRPRVARR
jgi:hypothetical protein